MKFIIGEGTFNALERFTYRGGIGIFFNNTLGGICAYILFAIFCLLALIGLVTTIKWLLILATRKKETPGERWRRTGRIK